MWQTVFLIFVIALLFVILIFGIRGVYKQHKLQRETAALREELKRIHEINEALRKSLGVGSGARLKQYADIAEFVRDLESLRCAIAGSKICEEMLHKKYGLPIGPELLRQILAKPGIDYILKARLADEMLVGEIGRSLLKSLDKGYTVERAAAEARVPLMIAKGQITRLQILGYLDSRLRPTERGREALL